MVVQRWMCFSNNKNTFVKIVHPGGHVELQDRPVLASEILNRNPKSYVAHPNIFRQPWAAVVPPETTLMPGQKFYVVPKHTLQRLQESSPVAEITLKAQADSGNNGSSNKSDDDSRPSDVGCFGRGWLRGFKIIARSDNRDEMKSMSSFGSCEMKAISRKNNGGSGLD